MNVSLLYEHRLLLMTNRDTSCWPQGAQNFAFHAWVRIVYVSCINVRSLPPCIYAVLDPAEL